VVVDYLQKVPQYPEPSSETEKVTFVVNGLKDIALAEQSHDRIVAADKEAQGPAPQHHCADRRRSTTRPTSSSSSTRSTRSWPR